MDEYPEVTNFARVQSGWGGWGPEVGDQTFFDEKLAAVDSSFFEIFSFPFIQGDPATALQDRYSIVLTEQFASKAFGDEDPMGKIVKVAGTDMTVTGVIENLPVNSHFQFDFAFPAINMSVWRSSQMESWSYLQFATYLELADGANPATVELAIADLMRRNDPESGYSLSLQPLTDIHLRSTELNYWMVVYPNPGNLMFVYVLSVIAICVLLVACMNFMNLATARSSARTREVGIRKATGARRKDLILQFLGETMLLALISMVLAIGLAHFLMPAFNELSGKELVLDYASNLQATLGVVIIVILTGLTAGSYPALYLSSFHPSRVLSGYSHGGTRKSGTIWKVLVIGQFAFTIGLLIVSAVIYRQIDYIQTRDLGFDEENLIYVPARGDFRQNYDAVKSELLQNPEILIVSSSRAPGNLYAGSTDVDWEGKNPGLEIAIQSDEGDYDYVDVFGIEMTEGRYYSRDHPSDSSAFVLNETAIRMMGIESPIGKSFTFNGEQGTIIGVARDYHGGSAHLPVAPRVMKLGMSHSVFIKFRQGSANETVSYLEDKWSTYVTDVPFQYTFLDDTIDAQYKTEKRMGTVSRYGTSLAILISLMGLFGLASFMAEKRTREVGIRKAFGASVSGVVKLFTNDFLKWILIANVIAWPLAWYVSDAWLQDFVFRIQPGLWTFLLSGSSVLLLTLVTISFQAMKAATSNPIDALRHE